MVFAIKFLYLFICVIFIISAVKQYTVARNVCYLLSAVLVGICTLYLLYIFLFDLIATKLSLIIETASLS